MSQLPSYNNSDPASRYLAAGKQLLEMRRFREAVEQLTKYVRECPEDPAGHYHLARGLYGLKRYEEAILSTQQSLRLNPQASAALYLLALGKIKKSAIKEAEEILSKVVEMEPNNPEYWTTSAIPSLIRNDFSKAEKYVDRALKVNPEFPIALNYKAQALLSKGDLTNAKQLISLALSKEPSNSMHHAIAGQIEAKIGNYDNFKFHFDNAISSNPNQVEHRYRYLNTLFTNTFISKAYHPVTIWSEVRYILYYLFLFIAASFLIPYYFLEKPEIFKYVATYFFCPILLLFSLYIAIPTVYKLYQNGNLWGSYGVDMLHDILQTIAIIGGTGMVVLGFVLQNYLLIKIGILSLLFTGGLNGARLLHNLKIRAIVLLTLLLIPFIIIFIIANEIAIVLNMPIITELTSYLLILLGISVSIGIKNAWANKHEEASSQKINTNL